MARGKLFEYAVLHHPKARKARKDAEGNETTPKSSALTKVQTVLAESDKEVAIMAARAIPEEYEDRLEEVEIVVRPF